LFGGYVEEASGLPPLERLARLEANLRTARSVTHDLEGHALAIGRHLTHLRTWPEACVALREASLLADGSAA